MVFLALSLLLLCLLRLVITFLIKLLFCGLLFGKDLRKDVIKAIISILRKLYSRAVNVLNDDVPFVDLRLKHRQLALHKLIALLNHCLVVELADHRRVLVLTRGIENHSRGHRWVHIEVVKDLPVACGIDPREVQCRPCLFSILANGLQECYTLAMAFLLVINLIKSYYFRQLTPVIAGSTEIAHAVRLRQISSKSA